MEIFKKIPFFIKILIFTSTYAFIARNALLFFAQNGIVSIVWPPSGIALAVILLGGKKYIPGIFLGAFVANYFSSQNVSAMQAFFIAFGNTLEAVFGFWILNRNGKFDNSLSTLNSFFKLVFFAGFGASTIAAVTGSSVIFLLGSIPEEKYFINMIQWWMGDSLGIILFSPFILVWSDFDFRGLSVNRMLQCALFLGVSIFIGQIVFVGWLNNSILAQIARGYWMFLVIAIAAVIFQNKVMLVVLLCTSVQALVGVYLKVGFFGDDMAKTNLSNYWFYMLILTLVGMTLSSYITERKNIEEALEKSEAKLTTAQSLAHIGHWELDPASGHVQGSDELFRIFGLPKNEFTLEAFANVVHPEDREYDLKHIKKGIESGENWDIEHRLLLKDGILKYVNTIGQAIVDKNGKTTHLFGTVQDITERKKIEENLNQTLHEKETLIRELYHRTKNTLQVVRSMLLLQTENFSENIELQNLIRDTDLRIQAIIIVHNLLFKSRDLSKISIDHYIRELCNKVLKNFDTLDRISIKIEIEDQNILLDTAIPLGLVFNELMTNSLKHAFPGNKKGLISIKIQKTNEESIRLIFSDDGIGVGSEFDFRNLQSLGMKFIFGIGEKQMQGHVNFENKNGVKCTIDFPITLYKPRV